MMVVSKAIIMFIFLAVALSIAIYFGVFHKTSKNDDRPSSDVTEKSQLSTAATSPAPNHVFPPVSFPAFRIDYNVSVISRTRTGYLYAITYINKRQVYSRFSVFTFTNVTAFDYHLPRQTLYYATADPDVGILWKSFVRTVVIAPKSRKVENLTKTAMAVDDVNDDIFVLDGSAGVLYSFDLSESHGDYRDPKIIMRGLDRSRDVVVDPEFGSIFVLQSSSILQADIDGSNEKAVVQDLPLQALAIDRRKTTLYFSTLSIVESYNYATGERTPISANFTTIYNLSVFKDKLHALVASKEDFLKNQTLSCTLVGSDCVDEHELFSAEELECAKAYDTVLDNEWLLQYDKT